MLAALLASGCCRDTGTCPQNDVLLVVSAEQANVPVTIVGYDFECAEADGVTLCRPGAIADGEYRLVVQAEGYEAEEVALTVRTNVAPSFSCECEIPAGSASVQLGASPSPDAGVPALDGG